MYFNFTNYLLPKFSFKSGAASCFDITGQFFKLNFSDNGEETDRIAHLADMLAMRQDFRRALAILRKEIEKNKVYGQK